MTTSTVSVDLAAAPATPRPDGHPPAAGSPHRGWAVVEILRDGSLGPVHLVSAAGPHQAVGISGWEPDLPPLEAQTPDLETRVGLSQAAGGHLREAQESLTHAFRSAAASSGQTHGAGQLALVEAFRGDLRRASAHARLALSGGPDPAGERHARLALAWTQLERGELDECGRGLETVEAPLDQPAEPWLATARLLLEARLLVALHRPDAATRLLAGPGRTGWPLGVLTAARAEALLAAGEPQRALAVLTPMPAAAVADASVATAAGRYAVGDVRGADAVLRTVAGELERAPLALQIRAWVLESRLAEHRGKHGRSRLLVDRALGAAAAEDMRTPLAPDWPWLRGLVGRDPALARRHRRFLGGFGDAWVTGAQQMAQLPAQPTALPPGRPTGGSEPPGEPLVAQLTQRETQVLELLAQMYSTDEIAAALFVSANTVKTHLKGIFGKLCVNRRVDAVRRGRRLGLC